MEALKLLAKFANPKTIFKFSNVVDRAHPDFEDAFKEGRLKGMLLYLYIVALIFSIAGILQIAF